MLSQPVHRDCIINAKFVAALIVIGIMLFVLGFLVMGCGLIAIGIPPTAEEFWRIVFFLIISVVLCGILAESGHSVFALLPSGGHLGIGFGGGMVVFQRVLYDDCQSGCQGIEPSQLASPYQIVSYQKFILGLMRLAPSELFNEATTTLLMPSSDWAASTYLEHVRGPFPVRCHWDRVFWWCGRSSPD